VVSISLNSGGGGLRFAIEICKMQQNIIIAAVWLGWVVIGSIYTITALIYGLLAICN